MNKLTLAFAVMLLSGSAIAAHSTSHYILTNGDLETMRKVSDGDIDLHKAHPNTVAPYALVNSDAKVTDGDIDLHKPHPNTVAPYVLTNSDLEFISKTDDGGIDFPGDE